MINAPTNLFKLSSLALLVGSSFFYFVLVLYESGNSSKVEFIFLNLILMLFLLYQVLDLSDKQPYRLYMQPHMLTIGIFFIGMNLLPNLRLIFGDPADSLTPLFVIWQDDPYIYLNKAMLLTILSAAALFGGYRNNFSRSLGIFFREQVLKLKTFSSNRTFGKDKSSLLVIFIIVALGIASLVGQISIGLYGYGVSEEVHLKYASYAQLFRYLDQAQLVLLMILAFSVHDPKKQSPKILIIIMIVLLIFISLQGFIFGSKGKVIFPIVVSGVGAYLVSGKIIMRYVYLSFLALVLAYVVIEPYRIVKNIYPDASFSESIALLESVPDLIEEENVEKDISTYEKVEDISFWFFGRLDQFSFGANSIAFIDKYGIPYNPNEAELDFLGSIVYSPVLAFVPRAIWKNKPRDNVGGYMETNIVQSGYYSATEFGAVAYAYYAGGVVAIFCVFYFFGVMQRVIFESFFKLKNLEGLITYFALILPVVYIGSAVGGVITGFFRAIPVIIVGILIIFLDYNKVLSKLRPEK